MRPPGQRGWRRQGRGDGWLLLALLTASGQLEEVPADAAFLGELALDGSLRPVSGVLPMALAAAEYGIRALYVPAENAAEGHRLSG